MLLHTPIPTFYQPTHPRPQTRRPHSTNRHPTRNTRLKRQPKQQPTTNPE